MRLRYDDGTPPMPGDERREKKRTDSEAELIAILSKIMNPQIRELFDEQTRYAERGRERDQAEIDKERQRGFGGTGTPAQQAHIRAGLTAQDKADRGLVQERSRQNKVLGRLGGSASAPWAPAMLENESESEYEARAMKTRDDYRGRLRAAADERRAKRARRKDPEPAFAGIVSNAPGGRAMLATSVGGGPTERGEYDSVEAARQALRRRQSEARLRDLLAQGYAAG